ncbi:MAG: YciK family oxidoreductase [Candidatus Malihini olakiniferum]
MHYQPMNNLLKNRLILVTGAGDGIGREAALTYARYGAHLILLGRIECKLHDIQAEILQETGTQSLIIPCNLLTVTHQECAVLAANLENQISHIDGVLHNAGILGDIAPITGQHPITWHQVMQVNVNATFMLTQALLPLLLKAASPSLVFTSSSVGRVGRAEWGAYSVSKFATEGLMQVLADEYRTQHLRVNCINPGGTRTAMRASAFPKEDSHRLKNPGDIMPLYLYLMGDDSKCKTGISFDAQPGRIPGPSIMIGTDNGV